MVAVPLLGGALLRLLLGLLTDHIGARCVGILGMAAHDSAAPSGLALGRPLRQVPAGRIAFGCGRGQLRRRAPLASRWYPPRYQGLATGIAGTGNTGTALVTFLGPRLAQVWGWHAVFGVAILPLLATLTLFVLFAKDSPSQPAPRSLADYADVLRRCDTWWFCLYYSITFGGFVGLASFLNIFFLSQYGLSRPRWQFHYALCRYLHRTSRHSIGSWLNPAGQAAASASRLAAPGPNKWRRSHGQFSPRTTGNVEVIEL